MTTTKRRTGIIALFVCRITISRSDVDYGHTTALPNMVMVSIAARKAGQSEQVQAKNVAKPFHRVQR